MARLVKNPTSIREDVGSIPGLTLWDKDPALLKAAAQVSDACSLDLVLLWLWCTGVALKSQKKKKKKGERFPLWILH